MTTLYKACKQNASPTYSIHYDVPMKDRSRRIYVVRMIEVEHICDPQQLPNFKNIQKKFPLLFMRKILQNLKHLDQNVWTNNGTKRIYTPPAASEFKSQILEAKKQIKTPNSKSPDFKSKVSKDTQSVNILQCASGRVKAILLIRDSIEIYCPMEGLILGIFSVPQE